MSDPLGKLAEQIYLASTQIEAELRDGKGPLVAIWQQWKKNAVESLSALVTANVYDPQEQIAIVTHQNEVKRYVEYTKALVIAYNEGVAIDEALSNDERRELIEMVRALPPEERAMVDIGDREGIDETID